MTDQNLLAPQDFASRKQSSIELSKPVRSSCVAGAILSAVYAGIALWRGEDGAATVAFVALAALLIILGAAGVVPRRIKSGENEVEITRDEVEQAASENADVAIETMTRDEIRAFIDETLRQSQQGDPTGIKYTVASRAQQAADFTDRILEYLGRGSAIEVVPAGSDDKQYDAVLKVADRRVAVNVRWSLTESGFRAIVNRAYSNDFDILMVVAYQLPTNFDEIFAVETSRLAPPRMIVVESNFALLSQVRRRLENPSSDRMPLANVYSTFDF